WKIYVDVAYSQLAVMFFSHGFPSCLCSVICALRPQVRWHYRLCLCRTNLSTLVTLSTLWPSVVIYNPCVQPSRCLLNCIVGRCDRCSNVTVARCRVEHARSNQDSGLGKPRHQLPRVVSAGIANARIANPQVQACFGMFHRQPRCCNSSHEVF